MLADNLSTSPHRSGNGGGWTEREIKGKRKRESKVNENYHINLVSTFRCSPLFCTDCVIRRAMEQLAVCFMEGPGLSGVGRDEFSSAVVIRHLEVSVCEVYQEMNQWWCASGEMTACPSLSPNREPQETTNMSWSQFRQAYKFWLACLTGKAIWLWVFFYVNPYVWGWTPTTHTNGIFILHEILIDHRHTATLLLQTTICIGEWHKLDHTADLCSPRGK